MESQDGQPVTASGLRAYNPNVPPAALESEGEMDEEMGADI